MVREAYSQAIHALMFAAIRESNIRITPSTLKECENSVIFSKSGEVFLVTQLRELTVMNASGSHMSLEDAERMYGPFFRYPPMLHEGSGLFGGMHK